MGVPTDMVKDFRRKMGRLEPRFPGDAAQASPATTFVFICNRCQENMVQIRLSRPDSGLDFQLKVLKTLSSCPPFDRKRVRQFGSLLSRLESNNEEEEEEARRLIRSESNSLERIELLVRNKFITHDPSHPNLRTQFSI